MSESMIDRLTRALRTEIDGQDGWSGRIDFEPIARAVLNAMREMTMVYRDDGQVVHEIRGAPDDIWKAFMDAALETSPYTYHQVEEDKPDNSLLAS